MLSNFAEEILEVFNKVHELYGIEFQADSVEEAAGGYLSRNFIPQTKQGKFFLKQYRFDNPEKIKNIHLVKEFFAAGGVPVVLPIKNIQEETFFLCAGKYYALFPFVTGNNFSRTDGPSAVFVSAGKMLAKMHLWSAEEKPSIDVNRVNVWDKDKFMSESALIEKKLKLISQPGAFDLLAMESLAHKTETVTGSIPSWKQLGLEKSILVHGDFHGDNFFHNEAGEIIHVFDFEKAEYSPRVLEVIRSMNLLCFHGKFEDDNYRDAKIYLDAYRSDFPLSDMELRNGLLAYWLKKAHALWIEKEHYLLENNRVDCFLNEELSTLKYYAQNFDSIVERLSSVS